MVKLKIVEVVRERYPYPSTVCKVSFPNLEVGVMEAGEKNVPFRSAGQFVTSSCEEIGNVLAFPKRRG